MTTAEGKAEEPVSSQGRQAKGPDAVLQSTEQKSSVLCSMLSRKSQIPSSEEEADVDRQSGC